MITPISEKLLLNGGAKNRIHHIGYGMFSQLQIPTDSFIVIHKIYWNGFFNQKHEDISTMSWKQFFRDSEYSLKIQSDKESPMYYQLRNEVNFQFFNNADPVNALKLLNAPINTAQYDDYILMTPKKPVIFDTFITAYDYLNFTISRNALYPSSTNFGAVNSYANEKTVPNGVAGQLVELQLGMAGTGGTTQTINMPSPIVTAPSVNPTNQTSNYHQDLDPPNGLGDNGSFLQNPLGGIQLKYSEYVTNPLISFEYCIIQKNKAGNLSSL